jgi:hypothetical protein
MLMNTVGEKLSLKCSLLLNGSTVGLLNGHERYDRLSNKPVSALDFDDLTNIFIHIIIYKLYIIVILKTNFFFNI